MKNPISPEALPGTLEESMRRLVATAVNGAEYVRFGGLKTEDDPAPFDVVAEHRVGRLRHYFPDAPPGRPAVLLLNAVSLFFVVFHAVTWFNLAPKAMVMRWRGRRVPGAWVAASNYGAWALVSALVAWLVLQ